MKKFGNKGKNNLTIITLPNKKIFFERFLHLMGQIALILGRERRKYFNLTDLKKKQHNITLANNVKVIFGASKLMVFFQKFFYQINIYLFCCLKIHEQPPLRLLKLSHTPTQKQKLFLEHKNSKAGDRLTFDWCADFQRGNFPQEKKMNVSHELLAIECKNNTKFKNHSRLK